MAICTTCEFYTDVCDWYTNCGYKETDKYTSMIEKVKKTDFSTWNFSENINYGTMDEHFINMPDILTSIEISDGIIIDSGFVLAGNFYFHNYHMFIYEKATNGKLGHYWRYKN